MEQLGNKINLFLKKIANDKKEKERKKVKEKQKKEQYGFIRKKDKRKK